MSAKEHENFAMVRYSAECRRFRQCLHEFEVKYWYIIHKVDTYIWFTPSASAGARHEVWLGGQIQVRQTHLPPNSNFSSNFGHFISKVLENLKIDMNSKFFFKTRDFWGTSPKISDRGSHPHTSATAPMRGRLPKYQQLWKRDARMTQVYFMDHLLTVRAMLMPKKFDERIPSFSNSNNRLQLCQKSRIVSPRLRLSFRLTQEAVPARKSACPNQLPRYVLNHGINSE